MVAPVPALLSFAAKTSKVVPAAAAALSGSGGALGALQRFLEKVADKEAAVREKVQSRLHVVYTFRPLPPKREDQDHSIGASAEQASFVGKLSTWIGGGNKSSSVGCDSLQAATSWATGSMHCTNTKESPDNEHDATKLDLGHGAERHEMVICKVNGYICVDYKGMMYQMLTPEGKIMSGGVKAFKLNVFYDMIRSAVVNAPTPDAPYAGSSTGQQGIRSADSGEGIHNTSSKADQATPMTFPQGASLPFHTYADLREAMGTGTVNLRAEMHCLRGQDVLFATLSDAHFTCEDLIRGSQTHMQGKEDETNAYYCKLVSLHTAAALAQCEILNIVDLQA